MSFVSKETSFDGNGNIRRKEHPSQTLYLDIFGAGEPRTTTTQRIQELKNKQITSKNKGIGLKDVTEAFCFQPYERIYNELFKWYQWVLTEDSWNYLSKNPNTSEDDRKN